MPQSSPPEASIEQEFWDREFDAPVPPGARREARPMPPRPAFTMTEYDGLLGRVVERMREWRDDARFGVVVLVVIAVVAGVVWYRIGISGGDDAVAAPNGASAASAGSTTTSTTITTPSDVSASGAARTSAAGGSGAKLVVHVAGAVVQAGVVELPATARVTDAIKAAGGAQADGDLDRLNLAAKLTDGERVYVPKVGQADPGVLGGSAAGASSGASGPPGTPGSPINLNTATQAQLESLPGIGPVYAQAIIAERQARGGFKSVNELRNVRGIGEARFADLAPLVTV